MLGICDLHDARARILGNPGHEGLIALLAFSSREYLDDPDHLQRHAFRREARRRRFRVLQHVVQERGGLERWIRKARGYTSWVTDVRLACLIRLTLVIASRKPIGE